jgi:hypothetical protein
MAQNKEPKTDAEMADAVENFRSEKAEQMRLFDHRAAEAIREGVKRAQDQGMATVDLPEGKVTLYG